MSLKFPENLPPQELFIHVSMFRKVHSTEQRFNKRKNELFSHLEEERASLLRLFLSSVFFPLLPQVSLAEAFAARKGSRPRQENKESA